MTQHAQHAQHADEGVRGMLKESSILITGGTGTFGSRLVATLLSQYPVKKVIVFSRDEVKQSVMLQLYGDDERIRFFLGDVRDESRLRRALRGVDFVVHCAALKQIPLCEYNPHEAIATNIDGTRNVINAALDCGVKRVLALSSDKATAPLNLYGATKLVAEKLLVQANSYSGASGTRFCAVRYGNVLGSRGSVVPTFLKQRTEGRVTITDNRMTRFWMTTGQAVDFVLASLTAMSGGEVFIPKLPSMRVRDLAIALAPGCEIVESGIRPGEKLHESMLTSDESRNAEDYGDRLILFPAMSFWSGARQSGGRALPEGFHYSSDTNDTWLEPPELHRLLNEEI